MYLVDTNIWLERLLEQERSGEVKDFLDTVPSRRLWMTDFAFHSICLSLLRLKQVALLQQFVADTFLEGNVALARLAPADIRVLIEAMSRFNLDFDDAYQYTAAEKYNLTVVSFDADFDRTERGRKTPGQIVAERPAENKE